MLYPDTIPSFKNIFDTYCDINEIDLPAWSEQIIDAIINKEYTTILTFHKFWFLRYYFDLLVKWEISFEQFMTMGDIEWQIEDQINPHVYREEHPSLLKSLTPEIVQSRDEKTLVVIDKLMVEYYTHTYGKITTQANIIVL